MHEVYLCAAGLPYNMLMVHVRPRVCEGLYFMRRSVMRAEKKNRCPFYDRNLKDITYVIGMIYHIQDDLDVVVTVLKI